MKKPEDLRKHLEEAFPEFAAHPENLIIYIDEGNIICTAGMGLSHEYQYTLTLLVSNFAGDIRYLSTSLLVWVTSNQLELLQNPDKQQNGIPFKIVFTDHDHKDIDIQLDLIEYVIVQDTQDENGQPKRIFADSPEPPHPSRY